MSEQTVSPVRVSSGSVALDAAAGSYSGLKLLGLWAVTTAPLLVLSWVVAPPLIGASPFSPAITYGALLLLGRFWQGTVALWLVRRETGSWAWPVVRRRIGLVAPRHPRTGAVRRRLLWRSLPRFLLSLPLYAVEAALPFVALFLLRERVSWLLVHLRGYRLPLELVTPELAGRWDLLVLVMLGWVLNAYVGEELLYRGVLLPRMRGRGRWLGNAALYALSHLHHPWAVPLRFLASIPLARPAHRLQSLWPAILTRSAQGVALLALLLVLVMAPPMSPIDAGVRLPHITVRPEPGAPPWGGRLGALPGRETAARATGVIELRNYDLSGLDLAGRGDDVAYATFDTHTVWPSRSSLPPGFDPESIMEIGKNPGLGVRALHARGITGRGVGVGIIDQTLLVEHQEYADRVMWYETLIESGTPAAAMHGPAVASIAVGETVGVAPEADLYYIDYGSDLVGLDFHYFAHGIRRFLALNAQLPPEARIRVISLSTFWLPQYLGYDDMADAVAEAEAQGILVTHVNGPMGLGRDPLADPDDFARYEPGLFWASGLYDNTLVGGGDRLLVPMDSRTVASQACAACYAFYRDGGQSWVAPYVAGVYALAVQADPAITPDRFWALARETGRELEVTHEGEPYAVGRILDPVALLDRLLVEP